MRNSTTLALLAGAALLVAGCGKQGFLFTRIAGQEIKFGANARTETRTVYGEDRQESGKTIQAIDWIAADGDTQGDKIRIYSPEATRADANGGTEHWADYEIAAYVNGNHSVATLRNVQSNGLAWGTADSYSFYSVYPSPAAEEENLTANGTSGKFAFTIPGANQAFSEKGNMQYAYMTAVAKDGAGITGDKVNLEFHPDFSAFEISVRSAGAPIALQEFRLISEADALAGSYTVDLNAADKYDFSAADETFVSVNLKDGDSYKVAETDKDLTFTVFTLPRDLNKLSVRFTTADGITRTLKLKKNDQFINFTGGRKHRIYGLYLPNGELLISVGTKPWEDGGSQTYTTIENVTMQFNSVRRWDDDLDFSTWDIPGTYIAIAPGIQATETIDGVEVTTNRPLYTTPLTLETISVGVPLQLRSSNPHIGFVVLNGNVYSTPPAPTLDIPASTDLEDLKTTVYYVVPTADAQVGETADITLVRMDAANEGAPIAYSHEELPGSYDHTKVPFKVVSVADYSDNTKTQIIVPVNH